MFIDVDDDGKASLGDLLIESELRLQKAILEVLASQGVVREIKNRLARKYLFENGIFPDRGGEKVIVKFKDGDFVCVLDEVKDGKIHLFLTGSRGNVLKTKQAIDYTGGKFIKPVVSK